MKELLRKLPSVEKILEKLSIPPQWDLPRPFIVYIVREVINSRREEILAGKSDSSLISVEEIQKDILEKIKIKHHSRIKRVVNATGVIIHTNFGRAIFSKQMAGKIAELASGYCSLEYDLIKGERGQRGVYVQEALCHLTSAEDALVVNNNAAAVLLILDTFAKGKEVIISRGELIEIGGGFRLPKVLEKSGAILKEVGCTNRTHPTDYIEAINENTAFILKAHQSNFAIKGFTAQTSLKELVEIAHRHNLPLIYDFGFGCMPQHQEAFPGFEHTVKDCLEEGVDLVSFSGDKLFGGPQCGVILGKKELIQKMRKNQLLRAIRIDKLSLFALQLVVDEYFKSVEGMDISTVKILKLSPTELRKKALKLKKLIGKIDGICKMEIFEDESMIGGGSSPVGIKSPVLAIKPAKMTVNELEKQLRWAETPIIARIKEDYLIFDPRTLLTGDELIIANTLVAIFG